MSTGRKRCREDDDDARAAKRPAAHVGAPVVDGLRLLLPGAAASVWRLLVERGYVVIDVRSSVLIAVLRDLGLARYMSCNDRSSIADAASAAFRATVNELACFRLVRTEAPARYDVDDGVLQPSRLPSGVIGTPCSLHNTLVRRLRWHAHTMVVRALLGAADDDLTHAQTLAGPMVHRSADAGGYDEGWHRSVPGDFDAHDCTLLHACARPNHAIFGYWVNMDPAELDGTRAQVFTCVPGSHTPRVSAAADGGFAAIGVDDRAGLDAHRLDVPVPPGHMVLYYDSIVHAAHDPPRATADLQRIVAGFCLAPSDHSLLQPVAALDDALERQAVLPSAALPAGDMYDHAHGAGRISELADWAEARLKPVCASVPVSTLVPPNEVTQPLLKFRRIFAGLASDDEQRRSLPLPSLPEFPPHDDRDYIDRWRAWQAARAAARTPAEIPAPPGRHRHVRRIVPQTMPSLAELEAASEGARPSERVARYGSYTPKEAAIYRMTDALTDAAPLTADTWFDVECLKRRMRHPDAKPLAAIVRRSVELDRQHA